MKSSTLRVKGRQSKNTGYAVAQVLHRQAIFKFFKNPVLDYPYSLDEWSVLIVKFRNQISNLEKHKKPPQSQNFLTTTSPLKCKVRERID